MPADPNRPWHTSDPPGTPARTTLRMGTADTDEMAQLILTVLTATDPLLTGGGGPSQANRVLARPVETARHAAALAEK